jgi:hypothetical protein
LGYIIPFNTSGRGVEKKMTDKKGMKAQKASEKATVKMHDDVTASLDQLEHPGTKAPKGSDKSKKKK